MVLILVTCFCCMQENMHMPGMLNKFSAVTSEFTHTISDKCFGDTNIIHEVNQRSASISSQTHWHHICKLSLSEDIHASVPKSRLNL